MSYLADLLAYNAWANAVVLAATDELTGEQLAFSMPELGGSALELLDHTAQVQANFLGIMTGAGRPGRGEDRTYPAMRALLTSTSDGLCAALPDLERRANALFELPWFGRSFTIETGVIQVATHSVQHRAGICAGVARAGREVRTLDYIAWASEYR